VNGPDFLRAARSEYLAALTYYEARESGLGSLFAQQVDEALAPALTFPAAFRVVHGKPPRFEFRAARLRSFPVSVIYIVRDDTLVVVAVFHDRRRPNYWLSRIRH
jgi:toxin ParE1/3/4